MPEAPRLALLGGPPIATEKPPAWPEIDESDVEAVLAQLRCGELSAYEVESGPLFDFEAELRERFGVAHALLVSSGMGALQSAIFGLGLGPGDEVVVPAVTFPGTASILLHFGVIVRIADVDPETGNPGVRELEAAITERTRAVILAHAWGLPPDLESILTYLNGRDIVLIEDAARALGSRCFGREVGSFGAAGCFSFHELKAVPAGEGGVLLTSDREIYERAVALGHYFRCKSPIHLSLPRLADYHDSSLGLNLKIHPLAAALARSQFRRLDRRLDAMAENHAHFTAAIAASANFRIQHTPPWAQRVSRYGFNVHWRPQGADMPSLKAVVMAIKAEGVKVSTAGSPPLFRLPLFRRPEDSGLPGTVAGPRDDSCFPGASRHVASLLRFPSLFSSNPIWVERYARALDKVDRNLGALARWEKCQT